MRKPTDVTLPIDGSYDIDLTERVARQLQASALHVYEAFAMSSLPEALLTGSPIDDVTSIHVPLTLVTDGRRGFLILSTEDEDYDVEVELTELVDTIVPGGAARGDFVLRAITMFVDDPAARPRSLDITRYTRTRAVIEAAYESAFAGAPTVDHEAFLAAFRSCGYPVKEEREIRCFFRDYAWTPSAAFGSEPSRAEPVTR